MPQLMKKGVGWFKVNPQARKDFREEELRLLGESLRNRQLQPVGARADGTLLWGERRLRAAKLVGLETLDVIVTEEVLSETQIRLIQLTENIHRAELSGYEKFMACSELMCMNSGFAM